MSTSVLADRIAALRSAFLKELAGGSAELSNLLDKTDGALTGAEHDRLLVLTHSIAGRAGTFGFPHLSTAAADLHDIVEANELGQRDAAHLLAQTIAEVLQTARTRQ